SSCARSSHCPPLLVDVCGSSRLIPRPPTATLFPYTTLFRSGTALRHRGGGRGTGGLEGLPPASRRRRRLPGGYEKGIHPRARRRGRGPDPSAEPLLNSAHAPRAPMQARPDRIPFTLRHPPTSARRRDPAGLPSAATALSTRSRRTSMPQNILTERLDAGPVVCAEGFLF